MRSRAGARRTHPEDRTIRTLVRLLIIALVVAVLAALALNSQVTAGVAHTGCHSRACGERSAVAHWRMVWNTAPGWMRRHLKSIAHCESRGNPRAISATGMYRGKYQFSFATWRTVGGRGDPALAGVPEQDARAVVLYRRSGPNQWPVCQHR